MTQALVAGVLLAKPIPSLPAGTFNVLESSASALRAGAHSVSYQDTQGEKFPPNVALTATSSREKKHVHRTSPYHFADLQFTNKSKTKHTKAKPLPT